MTDRPVDPARLPAGFVLRRVGSYVKPVAASLVVAAVLIVANRALALGVPYVASGIIDHATGEAEGWPLDQAAWVLSVGFLVIAASQFLSMILFARVREKVVLSIRRDLFAHLLSLSVGFFHERRVGELMSRVSNDATVIQTTGTMLPVQLVRQLITLVGGIALIWVTNASLTLVTLAVVPPLGLVTFVFGRKVRRLSVALQDQMAASTIEIEESLSGVETVKSFARENHEVDRYETRLGHVFRVALRLAVFRAGLNACGTLLFFGGLGAVLVVAAGMIEAGEMSSGELVAFLAYTMFIGSSLSVITDMWSRWQTLLGAGRRVFQILLEQTTVADRPDAAPFGGSHQSIAFEHVDFAYPSQPDRGVLHDLSFEMARGEVIALVGESGAGKSTVASLLLRHHDVNGGAIRIDDSDLRDLRQRDLRCAIGVVPQEVVVFGRTLRENIAYGNLDATEAEIVAAARAAHALEFIERAPQGFDTLAGDRGVMLSGGERQRIAIARALLKSPSILILDEATSSLDSESENLVKDALETLMAGRTTLVIAHRLSTVERADRVLVLHRGRLVESGTHLELVENGGRYARLYRAGL